jgi:hypothetical protein
MNRYRDQLPFAYADYVFRNHSMVLSTKNGKSPTLLTNRQIC